MSIHLIPKKSIVRIVFGLLLLQGLVAAPAWAVSAFTQIAASSFAIQYGIQLENSTAGGQDVAFIDNGDYVGYSSVNFGTGAVSFSARVASAATGGSIQVRKDSLTGTLAGTCTVTNTSGWQVWKTVTCTVTGLSGVHNLYLRFTGGTGNLFNVLWFSFATSSSSSSSSSSSVSSSSSSPSSSSSSSSSSLSSSSSSKSSSSSSSLSSSSSFSSASSSSSSSTTTISAFNQIEAESYSSQSGTQTETSTEAGLDVGFIDNGDYLAFSNINFQTGGVQSLTVRVASAGAGGNVEAHLDSLTGTLVATCVAPVTGGWQTWTSVNCAASAVSGVHTVYLKFTGVTGAGGLFNINWFKFSTTPVQTSGNDVVGKLFVGYQGWFNAKGDGSPFGCWFHWSTNCDPPTPGVNVKFEIFPDTREYTTLYATGLPNLGNGSPASLFSSYDQSTVNKHFEWMRTYNIDGAAVQRFGAEVSDTASGFKSNRDSVAVKVKTAAEANARKFYMMYDITGMNASDWVAAVEHDWTANVVNTLQLTSSSAYARQNGKAVVCIWGIGFTDRPGTATEVANLITWFKNQNVYVIGGVPTYWRTGVNDSQAGFLSTYTTLDMISPWMVGRFGGTAGADSFSTNVWSGDFTYTQQHNIAYQPVLWPGSAWSNMNPGAPRNENPRLHGDFMWRQAYDMKQLGINTGYVAMFDEYDEGTAIAKAAENSSMIPVGQYFLTMDADGVAVSADFYLRLTGDINRMFRGDIPVTATHPTTFY